MTDPTANNLNDTPIQSVEQAEESRRISLQSGGVPTAVAGYEMNRCLGQGSYGTVYLATERKTGRQVAIKFFTNRRGLDWTLLTREVEKLAVLDASRDVVRLLDVGWDHDPPYFVMEYLPNQSVAALLESGAIPVEDAIEMTKSIARALVHAHGAGILHCDIKPANVLLDRGDEARLGDFGQSRLSSDQSPALGTFYYMAPEQASMDAIPDVRWDVYALGALLYHMVTGDAPYRNEQSEACLGEAEKLEDRLDIYRDLVNTSQFPTEHRMVPGIDKTLVDLIDRCLQRDPKDRTPNTQVILDTLEQRELNRAKRPLVWIGVLGPLLFLITLISIGTWAIQNAVHRAEDFLSERALSSDAATVHLLAASIDQELTDRLAELERLAVQLVPPAPLAGSDPDPYRDPFHNQLSEILDDFAADNERRMKEQRRTVDESIFVADEHAVQIYRYPWSDSIGRQFAYRDYFHGLGQELDPASIDPQAIEIRKTPGISLAFRSTVTRQYMVALSVPIWDARHENVVGILSRTLHLTELLTQWQERISLDEDVLESLIQDDRILSLIDMREERPYLLNHDWITHEENVKRLDDDVELKELLKLSDQEEQAVAEALKTENQGLDDDYTDPLADSFEEFEGTWLATFASLDQVDWVAVVQERRDAAVKPVETIYWVFIEYGFMLIVVFLAMLATVWWMIRQFVSI